MCLALTTWAVVVARLSLLKDESALAKKVSILLVQSCDDDDDDDDDDDYYLFCRYDDGTQFCCLCNSAWGSGTSTFVTLALDLHSVAGKQVDWEKVLRVCIACLAGCRSETRAF
eukprot:947325-Amphidinium_carterae.1